MEFRKNPNYIFILKLNLSTRATKIHWIKKKLMKDIFSLRVHFILKWVDFKSFLVLPFRYYKPKIVCFRLCHLTYLSQTHIFHPGRMAPTGFLRHFHEPVKNYDHFVKAGRWNLYINAGNRDKREKTPIRWDATETNLWVHMELVRVFLNL